MSDVPKIGDNLEIVKVGDHSLKQLQQSIVQLPPTYLISLRQNLTKDQSEQWMLQQFFWKWVGLKIDHLQRESMGYVLPDPLESPSLHPSQKAYLEIAANTFFAELNLMIAGWDLVKSAASENQREFPFTNPRELFAEYCKQRAIFGTQLFLSDDINEGETLKKWETLGTVRQDYRNVMAFYKGNLEPKEELRALQDLKDGDWFRFTVYAVWRHRLNKNWKVGRLKRAWESYIQAFKSESAMICQKDFFKKYNSRISFLKWHQGNALYVQDCRPVKWENS